MLTGTVGQSGEIAIRPDVLAGIQQASAATGIDFSYLMAQANRESSFDPAAQAKTSSAAGLYQFIEQTWFGVVKAHGAEHGRADLADAITKRSDGRYVVTDPAVKKEILDLRRDPAFAAAMAAEHASDNKDKLEDKLDRDATGADLYMAHFLGISGAIKFLRAQAETPDRTGASLFPKAAAANPAVFYTADGRARSVDEIYERFENSINADMEAYAELEAAPAGDDVQVAAVDMPTEDAGVAAAPGLSTSGYFGGVAGARAGTLSIAPGAVASPATQVAAVQEVRGFSRVGGLLSPLLLVTLAALPVASDDDKEQKSSSLFSPENRQAATATATNAGLLAQGLPVTGLPGIGHDPLQAGLTGAAFTY